MREHLRAELKALGWARVAVVALGVLALVYGAILAWRPHSAAIVLPIGAALVVLGLFLPADWTHLAVGPGGLEVDRSARIVQDTLAGLPQAALRELLPEPDTLIWAEAETEVLPRSAPIATSEVAGRGVRLQLMRQEPSPARPRGVACAVRRPEGELHASVPRDVTAVDRRGPTLAYEVTFPDAFDVDGAALEEGRYAVFWSTVSPKDLLAQSWFDWPPTGE